jgi:2-dehydropantoate 2-reductase
MIKTRRILVFGAGVIGSLFAVRFIQSGFDVTVLARGERLRDLQINRIRYVEKGKTNKITVKTIDTLDNDDIYDFIFVPVRFDQMESTLTVLKDNKSKNIVTLANAVFYDQWTAIIGDRLIPGFPGAGGDIKDGVLYAKFNTARGVGTVFGEIGGQKTERIGRLAQIFEQAKLPYTVEKNIQAFHLSHVAIIAPMRNFYDDSGIVDLKTAKSFAVLKKISTDIKENFAVLEKKKIPITPANMKVIVKLPNWVIILFFRLMLIFPFTKYVLFGDHAQRAKDDPLLLGQAFRSFK